MTLARTLLRPVAAPSGARDFGRLFWIISALGTLATLVLLITLFEWQDRRAMREDSERFDRHLVQMVGNVIWSRHGEFLVESQTMSDEKLRQHPTHTDLLEIVHDAVRGSNVLKLKIFSPHDGRTVFSTDPTQVGIAHRSDAFDNAMAGRVSSELTHRPTFHGIAGAVHDRDVLAAYLPYFGADTTRHTPLVVVEIYSDVTERVMMHEQNRLVLAGGVMLTLALMYLLIWSLGRSATKRLEDAAVEQTAQEERMRHQAFHDALTGLPNRVSFKDRCAALMAQASPLPWALLFIDLDRFKPINDSLGHSVGDEVLKGCAERIGRSMRSTDNVFRMGGDEFVVLMQTDDVAALAAASLRIESMLAKPFNIEGLELALSASVGIARWPVDHASLEQLVGCADLAMYSAKRAGANQHAFYDVGMKQESEDQMRVLNGLRVALERNEFVLHYQPRVNSQSSDVEAFEALLRWQHPERGLLMPAQFIDVLEDSPLIVDVGAWVLETAARQLAEWQREGHRRLRMSVNVAPRQFRARELVTTVEYVLKKTGIAPQSLELEITEGQLIHDLENAAHTVDRLKALGVMLSIDDFGTGYSSLSYLQKLPIDCLKIDRSFVRDLEDGALQNNIARTIASLAHSLEMRVVAEGVENDTQAALLRGWGCHELQGYLFSRPVDAATASSLLKAVPVLMDAVEDARAMTTAPAQATPVSEALAVSFTASPASVSLLVPVTQHAGARHDDGFEPFAPSGWVPA